MKVLHIDRNPYYGDEGASLNLTSLWKKFRPGSEPPQLYGANRDWNVDLIPKFIMANGFNPVYYFNKYYFLGKLTKVLIKTNVSKYLEWKEIAGTYVFQNRKAGFFSSGGPTIAKVKYFF